MILYGGMVVVKIVGQGVKGKMWRVIKKLYEASR